MPVKKSHTTTKVSKKKVTKRPVSNETEPVYSQFRNKPIQAIRYLLKVKKGIAKDALYRKEIGYVSIPWGKNDPKTNKGFGLKHIVEKHGWEFEKMNTSVEFVIPFTLENGELTIYKKSARFVLNTCAFRLVIEAKRSDDSSAFVITNYAIKKPRR